MRNYGDGYGEWDGKKKNILRKWKSDITVDIKEWLQLIKERSNKFFFDIDFDMLQ